MSAHLEVFADVGCPFTHVGLRRLVARRAEAGRDDLALRVRSWPLQIVNGAPLDPEFIAEEVVSLRQQIVPDTFAGFTADAFPTSTLPAMTLAAHAYDVGLAVGEAVSLEVRDLLFEQGVDVGAPEVLLALAGRHGVDITRDHLEDETSVRADHAEGERRGVIGSPHFFTPDGSFFCPSLEIERDGSGHLRILADPAAFEDFIRSCFAR